MNTEAFDESWSRHAAGLRKLLRDLLGDAHAAEDVAQQTWLTALRRPPEGERGFGAWLRRVAARHARDHARGEHRRERREQIASEHESVETPDTLVRLERIELVVQAVRQLSERNREIVLLRYYDDLQPAVIAERLGLPVATVKTRLRRSLAELRRRLEGRAFPAWVWLGGATMSFKTKAAAVAALLAIGLLSGVAWFALRELDHAREESSSLDALGGATASSEKATRQAESTRIEVAPAHSTDTEAPSALEENSGVRLEVVERGTGRAIPGARVLFVDLRKIPIDPMARDRERFLRERDLERTYAPYIEEHIADERGVASLPADVPRAWIGARHGELFGETYSWPESPSPLRLEIEPERTLRIRVLDATGAPCAGVAVGLRMHFSTHVGTCLLQGATGADGTHMFRRLERRRSWWKGHSRIGASFAFPMKDPPFLEFDLDAEREASLDLVLPPTGSVRLVLLDENGQPLARPTFAGIAALSREHQTDPSAWLSHSCWIEARTGEALFACVGLNLELTASLCVPGWTHRRSELRFAGPTSAGETIEAFLRIGPLHTALIGTFVDENGEALRDISIGASRIQWPSKLAGESDCFLVEANGRFRYVLDAGPLVDRQDRIDFASSARSDGSDPRRMWRGSIDLRAQTFPAGDHEVGNVVLRADRPLASGVVVDDAGAPLSAEFYVRRQVTRPGLRPEWIGEKQPASFVHPNGEFFLYGSLEPGELRLHAEREGYAPSEPVAFVPGEEGLRLVLSREAWIEGSVIVDDNVSRGRIRLCLDGKSLGLRIHRPEVLLDETGAFRVAGLRAGTATLRICLGPESGSGGTPPASADLLRLEGLELRAGERCADERLRRIDLRSLVREISIRVTDRDGAPLDGVRLAYRSSAHPDEGWSKAATGPDGAATFLVATVPLEVHLGKKGYRMLELPGVSAATEVVLQPGIPLEIEVGGLPALLLDGRVVRLWLRGSEQTRFPGDMPIEEMNRIMRTQRPTLGLPAPIDIGDDARAKVVLPGPGTYKAVIMSLDRNGRPESAVELADQSLTIGDQASELVKVRIDIQPEDVKRALEQLQRNGR